MIQTEDNDYTMMVTANLNIRMPLITSTKLSTTSLLFTMREELRITYHRHSLVIVDEGNSR